MLGALSPRKWVYKNSSEETRVNIAGVESSQSVELAKGSMSFMEIRGDRACLGTSRDRRSRGSEQEERG